ncbi:M20/M25/M40 family metallo-hydrolase [Sphingomonas baiyangensis]|uniref:M20/M25/M40 family metallo-hydrolase n=1 Tax=Sphingomonas baiyangensis TaxID=2572576 RepID=A0A4U1L645_9SPHN|nr:M20/M25/M40 family metallo-hydrolase [Sphingomonas baiyangensis]TKD51715.1 M20/M25/M40 family metallo-hydrolase [Sphingomonas baiyangensis]
MRRLLFSALLLATAPIAYAQQAPVTITPQAVRGHVEFLADDLLQGREAGTPGYDIAARYVATRFAMLGLEPANGDSWYQQVPLEATQAPDRNVSYVTIGGRRFAAGEDVVMLGGDGTPAAIKGDVVFVGHGLESAEHGLDDYAGLDVRGKVVAMLAGAPKSVPGEAAAQLSEGKTALARAKGATAILTIYGRELFKQYSWDTIAHSTGAQTALAGNAAPADEPVRAILSPKAIDALFARAPRSYAQVDTGAAVRGFALAQPVAIAHANTSRRFESPNVIGVIPGSDPALKNEVVLLMAHLDHVGVGRAVKGDAIYNGAMDNAAGTAAMLEVARAFAEGGARPKRTVMFAAVTAEEKGLLGSEWLAKHPIGAGKVVAVVNLDMPLLTYDFTDVVAFGAEHSTMGPLVAAAAAKDGVTLSPDPMPEENLFMRSDHYSFVQQGVPSVFLVTGHANGGGKAFRDFLATHYHKPSDDLSLPFNWNAAAKFARVNHAIAASLADAAQAPRWYADSVYGRKFAPDAPKATRAD